MSCQTCFDDLITSKQYQGAPDLPVRHILPALWWKSNTYMHKLPVSEPRHTLQRISQSAIVRQNVKGQDCRETTTSRFASTSTFIVSVTSVVSGDVRSCSRFRTFRPSTPTSRSVMLRDGAASSQSKTCLICEGSSWR